ERERAAAIRKLGGKDVSPTLVAKAVERGWSVAKASREFLKDVRGQRKAPAGYSHSRSDTHGAAAIAAGLVLRANVKVDAMLRRSQDHRLTGSFALDERTLDAGRKFREATLLDVCRYALQARGLRVPYARNEVIQRAFSSADVSHVFTTSVNALMIESYAEYPDTTAGWCRETQVNDFKLNDRIRLGKAADLKKMSRTETAQDTTFASEQESYRLARYTNKFQVSEQDIINDSMGALLDMPREMGAAGARLRPNLIYAILLSNPKMRDGKALFHADHGNLTTNGSAASATAFQNGMVKMAKQTDGGVALNLTPAFVLAPQDLKFTIEILLSSAERIIAASSDGTFNPLKNTMESRIDNRLGVSGVFDPDNEINVAGTATNYFFVASPATAPTIEVGYLAGSGQAPAIRPYVLDKGQWGMGWDVCMDIGAKPLDWRGLAKFTGQA
ncbi:MAG: hypothetical protein ACRC1K_06500, partial [Planctomycetia bacterium]